MAELQTTFRDAYAGYYASARNYDFLTEMAPGVWKVSRKSDRMEYLAQDITSTLFRAMDDNTEELTTYGELLRPDGHNMLQLISDILNHDNLVSLVDCFAVEFSDSGGGGRDQWFAIWDYCDAGNLGNLLVLQQKRAHQTGDKAEGAGPDGDNDTLMQDMVPDMADKFLPESFCWHVLVSVLKALSWLHDGVRSVSRDEHGVLRRQYEDLDWQSMLHRNITPQNIFLCHPRRREWYGHVKLGNYERLFVSSHCQAHGDTAAPTFSKALAPHPSEQHRDLAELIESDIRFRGAYPHQNEQPYTMVSEYRALGEILQAMMVEPRSGTHLRDIRSSIARMTLQNADYTARLKNLVVKLMEFDPWTASKDGPNPKYVTSDLFAEALEASDFFFTSGSDEANEFVTPLMAMMEGHQEQAALQMAQGYNSYQNVRDILSKFEGSA